VARHQCSGAISARLRAKSVPLRHETIMIPSVDRGHSICASADEASR
jgi:hypothetical protein